MGLVKKCRKLHFFETKVSFFIVIDNMKITREAILWYAIQYDGDWNHIAKAIKNHEPFQNIKYPYPYITRFDAAYPLCFLRLRYPPWIIFYQGKVELLNKRCVGVIGARKCSQEALSNTKVVVDLLKTKYCIVSGLAKGIDGMAHRFALDTIGVLGCGIDVIYPKENQDLFLHMKTFGLIISEYPCGVKPLAYHFPWRNRLIAALSSSLVVIEATYKSGTMLTVNECLELGVDIYCIPTAFSNTVYPGCNYLIANGAHILVDKRDIEEI